MPSKSLTPDEKAKVSSAIPTSFNKIFVAVPARIYFAHPQRSKWSYSGLQGALAFTHDKSKDAFVLKLVDFTGTRGVIWQHELYNQFEYYKDRPFFHSFAGDECMIGVVFAEEKDATLFYKKVTNRKAEKATKVSSEPKKVKKGGKIDKSMISGPKEGSFIHVAHVGYDEEKGFTSNNVDESWLSLVRDLQSQGVTEDVIEKNKDFIRNFVREAQQNAAVATVDPPKKKPPPPPVPRRTHMPSNSTTSTNGDPTPPPPQAPPQAPPRQPPRPGVPSRPPPPQRSSGPLANPPPPPVRPTPPSRPGNLPPATPSPPPPPPPPPPPVVRPTPSPPAPPRPPARPVEGGTPPPPPPPPPPAFRATEPPPSPPVPVQETSSTPPSPPPPPPPPPGVATSIPTPQPGRADLLASIRGQSVANLRKTPAPSSTPPPPPAPAAEEHSSNSGAGGGGDLTTALAAALMQRSKKLGDSDDDDDDDDEWD